MDINDIIEQAKQHVLKDGTHGLTFFIQTDTAIIIHSIPQVPPTPMGRQMLYIALAKRLAQEHPGVTLVELAQIMMAWGSMTPVNQTQLKQMPSKDPNRKELLAIAHLREAGTHWERSDTLLEVIRHGKTVDLHQLQGPVTSMIDRLLSSFIIAFRYPHLDVPAIAQLVEDELGPAGAQH